MKKFIILVSVLLLLMGSVAVASATPFDVYAKENSLKLNPLDTGINLNVGDLLTVSVAIDDTWAAGGGPRISNADGLNNFPAYFSDGLTTLYGTLVGKINGGAFFEIGTSFSETVTDSGNLFLLYWDSNYSDNFDYVTADITVNKTPIPEPATMLLFGIGLLGLAGVSRRKK